jgi:hypothetical protein
MLYRQQKGSWCRVGTVISVRRAQCTRKQSDLWDVTADLVATVKTHTLDRLMVELPADEEGARWTTSRHRALPWRCANLELVAAYDVTPYMPSGIAAYIDTALASCCTCSATAKCSHDCSQCWNHHVVAMITKEPDIATQYGSENGVSLFRTATRSTSNKKYGGAAANAEWREALVTMPQWTNVLYVDLDRASEQFARQTNAGACDKFVHDCVLSLPYLRRIVVFV